MSCVLLLNFILYIHSYKYLKTGVFYTKTEEVLAMKALKSGCCMRLTKLTEVFLTTRNCPKSDFTLKPDW